MGFSLKNTLLGLVSKKQKHTASTNNKISLSDLITRSPNYGIEKTYNKAPTAANGSLKRARDGKITTKSVTFDHSSCNRSAKVSPTSDAIVTRSSPCNDASARPSYDKDDTNAARRHSSSSACDSLSSLSGEVRMGSNNQTNPGIACKDQARLPSPKGLHSKNLSYGTIYNPARCSTTREESMEQEKTSNAIVKFDQRNNDKAAEDPKPVRWAAHVYGLGGCNYGHGSIINSGVKTLKCITRDTGVISGKDDNVEKQNSCFPYVKVRMADELVNSGNEEYKRGQYKNAIFLYNKAIALFPRNAKYHDNKAVALGALGKLRDAIDECLEAVTCDSTYSRAHYHIGSLYRRLGRIDDARKHFKLSGLGNGCESLQCLLLIEGHLKNMKRAMEHEDWHCVLEESTRAIEAGADACNLAIAAKAEALLKLRRATEALNILKATKKKEHEQAGKDSSRLLLIETQAYLYLGRFEEAVNTSEQAAKLEFDSECLTWLRKAWGAADAHRAGNEYYRVGKYRESFAMYNQALYHLPANPVILCNRAACRSRLGQWASTIEDCNAALKSYPDYSEGLLQRAYAHSRLGHWEDAHTDYLILSKLRPGDQTILSSLNQTQTELRRAKRSHWR